MCRPALSKTNLVSCAYKILGMGTFAAEWDLDGEPCSSSSDPTSLLLWLRWTKLKKWMPIQVYFVGETFHTGLPPVRKSDLLPINSSGRDECVLILKQNHCDALLAILQERQGAQRSASPLGHSNAFMGERQLLKILTTLGAMPRVLLRLFFTLVAGLVSALWAPLICFTCL